MRVQQSEDARRHSQSLIAAKTALDEVRDEQNVEALGPLELNKNLRHNTHIGWIHGSPCTLVPHEVHPVFVTNVVSSHGFYWSEVTDGGVQAQFGISGMLELPIKQ